MRKTLDAKKSHSGTQFEAVVDGNMHFKDGTELPRGTVLVGTVATDQMQTGGTSTLALRFTEAKLKDGKTFPVHAMIAEINGPVEDVGYIENSDDLPAWSGQTYQVDEIAAVHDADLHSSITDANSGVLVSIKKDDVKLVAGSRLSLAIAAQNAPMAVFAQAAPPISGVKGKREAVTHDSIPIQVKLGIVRIEPEIRLSRIS